MANYPREILNSITAKPTMNEGFQFFVTNLREQINGALSGTTLQPETRTKLQEVWSGVTTGTGDIVDALSVNTPAHAGSTK